MATLLCPHCGTPNRSGSNFCNRCGAALHAETQAGLTPEDTTIPPPAESGASAPTYQRDQPWLEPGFAGEDDVPIEEEEEDLAALDDLAPLPAPAARLVSGVQGLLDPIRVATIPQERAGALPAAPAAESSYTVERMRRVRALMAEEPIVATAAQRPAPSERSLWLPWIFLILGLGVAVPLLLGWPLATGEPALWAGVESGFDAVDRLETGSHVQILWAYDPATVGEMNLLSAPVLRHLLEHGATLEVVSLLPNGPATARRLFAAVEMERLPDLTAIGVRRTIEVRFLPGGATVLPLLASERADLAIIFAAQA
ncbi:MAG: zinc ribbon domain-containing protein, partial [Caldilinea sp.]